MKKTNQITFGRLAFDRINRVATIDGVTLGLSRREVSFLELLLVNRERILSKAQILDSLFDWRAEPTENAVEVLAARLRRKLAHSEIEVCNRRGLGYQLCFC